MRFSTFIFPFAILAGLVLASPLEERDTSVKVSKAPSPPEPAPEAANVETTPPSEGGRVKSGGSGVTTDPTMSKRSDYNELDGRAVSVGTFIVCAGYGCSGYCYGYTLLVKP